MKIKFIGHSAFEINIYNQSILIDPFITNNPVNSIALNHFNPNLILVTHGHSDHFGDAIELSKTTNSLIVSNFEIANYCIHHGAMAHPLHIGGSRDFNDIKVKLTMALHGSSIGACPAQYLGNPGGFLIKGEGVTIYHSGDTGLFGDMSLIGRMNSIDIACLPIGDNFTMGPEDALEAIKMLRPKYVIPMHYNTWELIAQNDKVFKEKVEAYTDTKVIILKPGQEWSYQ